MFHNADAQRRHKPISKTSYLLFNQNYSSKLRAKERKEKFESRRSDALDVTQFTRELSALIDRNNFEELEEKISFFNRILPQEITSLDVIKTLNNCLDLDNIQIKILTIKCLAKISAVNKDLIDDKHYIQLFSSDSIDILKSLLELYTYISKKRLNENNLKNLIKIAECLGCNNLDFFKNLANFTSSALADPHVESIAEFIVKSNSEIYRILESLPQNTHSSNGHGDINTIYVECVTDMLHSIHLCCKNFERKVEIAIKFINLATISQDILLPIYLIVCQAIQHDSLYQLDETFYTKLSTSIKSQNRRIKLASLVLATTMAGKNTYTAKCVLHLSNIIIDILESKESYDIRLESAIYIMHMMFGHNREFINNFIKIEPRISAAMLNLLDSCKQDYTTVWLCLDYLEWCLSNEESVRRLYDMRAIEIIESVQFLHNEEVDRRARELIKVMLTYASPYRNYWYGVMYIVTQYERAIELLLNFVSGYSTAERNLLDIRHFRETCLWMLTKRQENYQPYIIPKLESTVALDNIKAICNRTLSPDIISEAFNSESDISSITAKISIDLGIRDPFINLLKDALLQIRRFYCSVSKISKLTHIKVEQSNPKHCEMLDTVWKSLINAPLPSKYSKSNLIDLKPGESSWGILGFQKPFTDFRSAGYLGLLAMHHMSTIWTEETKSLLDDTNNKVKWLPFAITSINVTWWLVEFMKDNSLAEYGCLNGFFYRSELDPIDIFNTLHTFTFFQFCYFWMNTETTSIMDFPKISIKFKRSISQFFRDFTDSGVKEQQYINQIPRMIKVRGLLL